MSQRLTAAELQTRLAADPALTLLDVRTPAEFGTVHVPSARNIPLNELNPKALAAAGIIRDGRTIHLLCQSGRRATIAAEQFATAGFPDAVVIEGGTEAWVKAGFPVTRGTSSVISIERQVRIGAGALVVIGVVLGWFVHRYFLGLSAFVGAGLVFAGISDWCGLGLLLAKSPWNQRR